MRELIKTLIVLSFLFSVLYAIYGILAKEDYNGYLVVIPILLGVILLLVLNFILPEKKNPWIRERHDKDA